ncbi:MAG: tetratricopeptide repeat protein [Bacteroidales bacterium]|nr:tetratricopeptide repeat protein [Bacteroidales bacterium]
MSQTQEQLDAFTQSYTSESDGDYSKAIQGLKQIYSETSYPINLRLAWLSYSAGLFTESMAYYSKAIQLMPYSIEARLGITYPASAVGKWPLVIKTYQEVIGIDPKNYTANYNLASIYYGKKDYKMAAQYLETIANLYPFDYSTTLLYAWNNYQLGKTREAMLLFKKVLMLSPNDASAKEGLSLVE